MERLIAAFNAHDPDAMRALMAEDVECLRVDGDKVHEDARGADALRNPMRV